MLLKLGRGGEGGRQAVELGGETGKEEEEGEEEEGEEEEKKNRT